MTPDEVKAWDDYIRRWNAGERNIAIPDDDLIPATACKWEPNPGGIRLKKSDKLRLTAADILFLREVGIQL
jgi:hypothetical protein